ncbi:hypothetical protein D9611_009772 [Ephemerocybe angulata]|uniref:Uncharacterized protein n=1 Tax=Ephemerocybe angulata TaxID=980116 RepID=A0A8H5FJU6_9AGAR|nr:hypothetical protein D9611_009772 [Tulosesus angulatus]
MRLRALDFDSTYLAWGRETTGVDAWARVSPPRQELNKSGVKGQFIVYKVYTVTHFRIACASNATPSHSPKRSLRLVNVLKLDGVHWKDMTGFETRIIAAVSIWIDYEGENALQGVVIEVLNRKVTIRRAGAEVLSTCTRLRNDCRQKPRKRKREAAIIEVVTKLGAKHQPYLQDKVIPAVTTTKSTNNITRECAWRSTPIAGRQFKRAMMPIDIGSKSLAT